jgi:hypothetical protein
MWWLIGIGIAVVAVGAFVFYALFEWGKETEPDE